MGKIAILAEKPSQARAYADAYKIKQKQKGYIELEPCSTFPDGAYITWGIGHLVTLKEPKEYKKEWEKWSLSSLPILLDKYEDRIIGKTYEQFNTIKAIFQNPAVTTIYNGCDAEREGSNIFYSIYRMTKIKKPVKRIWVHSLEAEEIRKAFQHAQTNERDLLMFQEAKTRQISDWLVGMNCSRLFTLLLQKQGFKGSISIGRVQSPTVYLIYKRKLEIEQFKAENFYEIEGTFKALNGTYKGKAKFKSDTYEQAQQFLKQHTISENEQGIVEKIESQVKRIPPPKLHALSTLQATANKKWKYSPAQVLKIAQSLYEKKYISYPRTDSQLITENEFNYLQAALPKYQQFIAQSFDPVYRGKQKRFVDAQNVGEHYAIIPTKKLPTEKAFLSMAQDEKNIYLEILQTTLAMFHKDYEYEEKTVTTAAKSLPFKSIGKTEIEKGWKQLFKYGEQVKQESLLPKLSKGEQVKSLISIKEGVTTPPKPYTEGQLITMMKTCGKAVEDEQEIEVLKVIEGIGTEATRSGIIETIKKHGLIEVQRNIVSITEKGILMCKTIEGTLLASPSMTAKWEIYLKKIGNGNGSAKHFIDSISNFIYQLMNDAPRKIETLEINQQAFAETRKKDVVLCPTCKEGKIGLRKNFYGCSNYKNGCKQTFPDRLLGKKITEKMVIDLCSKQRTSTLKGFKSKNGKPFSAALVLKDGKIEFDFGQ